MEILGPPPPKLLEKSSRRKMFFDSTGQARIVLLDSIAKVSAFKFRGPRVAAKRVPLFLRDYSGRFA